MLIVTSKVASGGEICDEKRRESVIPFSRHSRSRIPKASTTKGGARYCKCSGIFNMVGCAGTFGLGPQAGTGQRCSSSSFFLKLGRKERGIHGNAFLQNFQE
jgi:hypothetical protein